MGPSQGKGRYKSAEIIEQRTTTAFLFFQRSAIIPQNTEPRTIAKLGNPTTNPSIPKSANALACILTIIKARP
jgi:hypothetical protein